VDGQPTVGDCVAVLDAAYDPALAADWDAVGLTVGDPAGSVHRVLFAVDPTEAVAAEAIAGRADLLVTHHPLWLRGTTAVTEQTAAGRVAAGLIRAGIALHVVHTNADVARPGVNDALAAALGLPGELPPLVPLAGEPRCLVHVYVPAAHREAVLAAMSAAGAGRIGAYEDCGYWTSGTGQFRPTEAASPYAGEVGRLEQVAEDRLELVCAPGARDRVVAALRAAHPYEEPAYGVTAIEVARAGGLGRVADLAEPVSFEAFLARVAAALPGTAAGVRGASPDPTRLVSRLALLAGAGDAEIATAAAAGADTYLTSDLRHHRTRDALDAGLAVVDVSHWAAERPWLGQAAAVLKSGLERRGRTVEIAESVLATDPWCAHVPSEKEPAQP
jgi:dinuclear metal center YbgI/SA1388 family protein